MLDAIRERAQGWIARIILGFIILTFSIWGMDWYFKGGGAEKSIAKVGGESITQRDFQLGLKNQKDAMEGGGGRKVNIDDPQFRRAVIDNLIEVKLLTQAAQNAGLTVPENFVGQLLGQATQFMDNGQFSQAKLDAWLRNRGMSQAQLVELVHQDVLTQQLQRGLGMGTDVASASLKPLLVALAQEREVSERVFDAKAFQAQARVDDAAVKADYEANKAHYEMPAQARVQYLVFALDGIKKQIKVDDAAVRRLYAENAARYGEPEQRSARHILIKAEPGMAAAERQKAKAKAEKLLAEVKAAPGRFGELAKQHSDDPGSAAKGGDLGFFARDRMVKPFADAAFALKKGEIGGLVESEFGYHILIVDAIRPGKEKPFEAVKAALTEEWLHKEAQKRFAEQAEKFGNLVYEQPNGLEPAAKTYGLKIETSDWISRARAQPALLASPRLLELVFAPESLSKRQNTEAVEVAPNTLVAARVIEHKPAGVKPLAEVADAIRQQLTQKVALEKARAEGRAALQAAQANGGGAGWSIPMTVSRLQPLNLPIEAVRALFKADARRLPAFLGVDTPDGYRLYRLTAVRDTDKAAAQETRIRRDVERLQARAELAAFMQAVRAQTTLTLDEKALGEKQP